MQPDNFQFGAGDARIPLPRYTCHKTVEAGKIMAILAVQTTRMYRLVLELHSGGQVHIPVPVDFIIKHKPDRHWEEPRKEPFDAMLVRVITDYLGTRT